MREAETNGGEFDQNTVADTDVGAGDDGGRVLEWEVGLPSVAELPPLSQPLLSPELAHVFRIKPEPSRTSLEVHRASWSSFDILRRAAAAAPSSATSAVNPLPPFQPNGGSDGDDPSILQGDDPSSNEGAAESSGLPPENDDNNPSASRTMKRPRLVWTPQLHKRFVDVVEHLGVKKAVPKTIMQLMNVEGLTRENVASHLQKFRQYLKRTQGTPGEDQSPSDPLFSSPTHPACHHDQPPPISVPVPYAFPAMIPLPVFGMTHNGPMGMVPLNNSHQGSADACHGSDHGERRLPFNDGGFSTGRP